MDLPYDVWHRVVSFVPHNYVRGLLGVNHTLFEIIMDKLYSTVEIRELNDRTWWIILNLRNPMISSRVRRLRFSYVIADDFYHAWLRRYQGDTWMTRARRAFLHAFHVRSRQTPPYWHHKIIVPISDVEQIGMSLHDTMTMLANALPALPNFSEFEDVRPHRIRIPAYDTNPLYHPGYAAFGSNLRKLALVMAVRLFPEVHLPHLQEFRITFKVGCLTREGFDDPELQNIVAPFINRHKSTIQTLSLVLPWIVDLSQLFLALETLPALRKLEIYMPHYYVPSSNLSGLARFFQNHIGTLHCLTWCHVGLEPHFPYSTTPLMFGTWLFDNAIALNQLKTICVSICHNADFESILVQFRYSVNSLAILSLQGYHLSYAEVDTLVSIFSSPPARLVKLDIWIRLLNPRLVLLLGERLPGLKELAMCAFDITPRSETLFFEEMKLRSAYFPDWHLYDIGICSRYPTHRIDNHFMYMLARFIPQVSSFWGRGYM